MEAVVKKGNPKREMLINLSNMAKQIREDMAEGATTPEEALFWSSRTVNYMLLKHIYITDGAEEFNTFNQWKAKGATIKKGSKAFAVWGQPIGKKAADKKEETEEADEYEFFPMCFLFSDKQVITAEEQEAEKNKRLEAKKEKEARQEKINSFETIELD